MDQGIPQRFGKEEGREVVGAYGGPIDIAGCVDRRLLFCAKGGRFRSVRGARKEEPRLFTYWRWSTYCGTGPERNQEGMP